MIPLDFIQKYPFFSFLNHDQQKSIAEISEEVQFAPKAIIYKEKERADWLYILVSGNVDRFFTVNVEYHPEQNKEIIYGEVIPGEMFGILALIEPRIHSSSARASNHCEMVRIDAVRLLELFEKDDSLAYDFMKQATKTIEKRLNMTLEQLASVWTFPQEKIIPFNKEAE
ncbi:MAG: cyclic nucleotide-binding domain-containing protein [Anaerolineaceae bacterium]|nr:cyclic nucleotide-binding domain-containing protein [Anaerolineaceae bacterium]